MATYAVTGRGGRVHDEEQKSITLHRPSCEKVPAGGKTRMADVEAPGWSEAFRSLASRPDVGAMKLCKECHPHYDPKPK